MRGVAAASHVDHEYWCGAPLVLISATASVITHLQTIQKDLLNAQNQISFHYGGSLTSFEGVQSHASVSQNWSDPSRPQYPFFGLASASDDSGASVGEERRVRFGNSLESAPPKPARSAHVVGRAQTHSLAEGGEEADPIEAGRILKTECCCVQQVSVQQEENDGVPEESEGQGNPENETDETDSPPAEVSDVTNVTEEKSSPKTAKENSIESPDPAQKTNFVKRWFKRR